MIAASDGLDAIVDVLVSYGADVHLRDDNGLSALYLACMGGHASIASFLISRGASPFATCLRDGTTPLHRASLHRRPACAIALLRSLPPALRLALVNQKNDCGETALNYAVDTGNIPLIKLYLAAGADGRVRNSGGYHPFGRYWTIEEERKGGVIAVLREIERVGCLIKARTLVDDVWELVEGEGGKEEEKEKRKRGVVKKEGEEREGRKVPLYLQKRMSGLCRVTRERERTWMRRRKGGGKRRKEVLLKGLPRVVIRGVRRRGKEGERRRMVGGGREQEQEEEIERGEQGRMAKRLKRGAAMLDECKLENMVEENEEKDAEEEIEGRKEAAKKEIETAKNLVGEGEKWRKVEDEQEEQEETTVEVFRAVVEGNVLTRVVFEELVAYMRCPWDPVVAVWDGGEDGREVAKVGGVQQ
ncbi:ankyrin repeat [Nannochloropsis oceanica]